MNRLMKTSFLTLLAITVTFPCYAENTSIKTANLKALVNTTNQAKNVHTLYKNLDQDAVADRKDQCLNTGSGYLIDGFGCEIDSDHDGVFDSLDHCPNTPLGMSVNFLGCEGDEDKDKVLDSKDKCPNTPLGAKVNSVGCKTDNDKDHDGVINSVDLCPNTPLGTKVNKYGCKPKSVVILPIVFNTASSYIRADQVKILNNAAGQLRKLAGNEYILITGHTDNVGSAAFNRLLSWNRAYRTKQYLVKYFNYIPQQIFILGEGQTQPIASNDTAEGRQQNRRIEFKVTKVANLPKKASLKLPFKTIKAPKK